MNSKKILIGFFLLFFLIFLFYISQKSGEIKIVKIAGRDIKVELAQTREIQEKGLSGREGLALNTGMLFVFEKPGKYYFWMKDMKFPIDMIWIDEQMKVIFIKKDAKPILPLQNFGPDANSKYVLEVNANFSEENNLQIGDEVKFIY
jgi:uncharacterized membrane protein (UPF0127 family)